MSCGTQTHEIVSPVSMKSHDDWMAGCYYQVIKSNGSTRTTEPVAHWLSYAEARQLEKELNVAQAIKEPHLVGYMCRTLYFIQMHVPRAHRQVTAEVGDIVIHHVIESIGVDVLSPVQVFREFWRVGKVTEAVGGMVTGFADFTGAHRSTPRKPHIVPSALVRVDDAMARIESRTREIHRYVGEFDNPANACRYLSGFVIPQCIQSQPGVSK